jgi:ferredoxin-NADP reductase
MAAQEMPLLGYRHRLLNRVKVAEGTMAFHFEKPQGFDFKPGQSADLTLLNPPETDSAAQSAWHPQAHRHRAYSPHLRGGNGSLCR